MRCVYCTCLSLRFGELVANWQTARFFGKFSVRSGKDNTESPKTPLKLVSLNCFEMAFNAHPHSEEENEIFIETDETQKLIN